MLIKFKCPHCQTQLSAGSSLAGQAGKCPKCHEGVTVPDHRSASKKKVEEKAAEK